MRKTERKSKPKQARKPGNCYEYAFLAILNNPGQKSPLEAWLDENGSLPSSNNRDIVVVHGTVTGAGGSVAGRQYGHAWCEVRVGRRWFVVDCGTLQPLFTLFPRHQYYEAGHIKPSECQRYDVVEACRLGAESNHYGPWDDRCEGNK